MTGKRKHTDVEAASAEERASGAGSQPQARETPAYEPPRVAVIGSLDELTQGATGTAEDGAAFVSP